MMELFVVWLLAFPLMNSVVNYIDASARNVRGVGHEEKWVYVVDASISLTLYIFIAILLYP